ncbi:hypothetical protein B0H65DRAFT_181866 [Neurospora tetraspora]|uniref:Secreted protein n=1 Tax=Neurospora tetraspora TaxID=94610 RepID=A0AAE0JEM6_9PEZI|nr:hypothetical protein B0H65DRAFT_181866 [Neurospora tetraspora]
MFSSPSLSSVLTFLCSFCVFSWPVVVARWVVDGPLIATTGDARHPLSPCYPYLISSVFHHSFSSGLETTGQQRGSLHHRYRLEVSCRCHRHHHGRKFGNHGRGVLWYL